MPAMTEPPNGWVAPAESAAPPWQPPTAWGAPPPPEAQPGVIPLRPLGLGELLDGAVTVVRRYPRQILGLSTAIAVVTSLLNLPFLLTSLGSPAFDPTALTSGNSAQLDAAIGGVAATAGASSLVSFLAGIVLAGVITAVVGKGVLGQAVTLGEAWRAIRPLILRLVGLSLVVLLAVSGVLLVGVAVAVLLVLAGGPVALIVALPLGAASVVVAVHLYVRFALAPSALVLERVGVRASLRRSAVLVKGDWWRVFGILVLTALIAAFVSGVLQAPFSAASFGAAFSGQPADASVVDVVLAMLGQALAMAVVAPFSAAVTALLYVDRRIRAEALDVTLAAAATTPAG